LAPNDIGRSIFARPGFEGVSTKSETACYRARSKRLLT